MLLELDLNEDITVSLFNIMAVLKHRAAYLLTEYEKNILIPVLIIFRVVMSPSSNIASNGSKARAETIVVFKFVKPSSS